MVFCQIDDQLLEIIHKISDGRRIIDLGAGECHFEYLYTKKYPDEGVVSIELLPQSHYYIDQHRVLRFDATMMEFTNEDLPIFIRPCHSVQFVEATLRNMENSVPECLYISNPRNLEVDIPEDYQYEMVKGWTGKDDNEKLYRIKLFGKPYVKKESEWWMVKLDHWPEPLRMRKVFRYGRYDFVNSKGGGFPCDAAEYAEPCK